MLSVAKFSRSWASHRLAVLLLSSNLLQSASFGCAPGHTGSRISPLDRIGRTSRVMSMSDSKTDHPLQTAEASGGLQWEAPKGVRVILGSQSFTRKLLLREMGIEFECVPANIDEKQIRREDPKELVQALADAKAEALLQHAEIAARRNDDGTLLLVTSDQVVVHEGQIREKPEDRDEARRFIRGYGSSPPATVGAIAVTNLQSGRRFMDLDTATIHFKPIPEEVIEQIVAQDMVLNCAGGLMVEDPLVQPFLVRIEGSMDSVMGLGKRVVHRLLSAALQPA